MPSGMWDLSSPARDEPMAPAVEAQSPNHWTARKLPKKCFFKKDFCNIFQRLWEECV